MACILHQHHHHHHHTAVETEHGCPQENINVRAAYVHVIGDFLQSFGVLVASLIIFYKVRTRATNSLPKNSKIRPFSFVDSPNGKL